MEPLQILMELDKLEGNLSLELSLQKTAFLILRNKGWSINTGILLASFNIEAVNSIKHLLM